MAANNTTFGRGVPPPNLLKPRKFRLNHLCTKACTLGSGKAPGKLADMIHAWFEAGYNNKRIQEEALLHGYKVSNGAVGRHRSKHIDALGGEEPEFEIDTKLQKVNHIEMLEQIIARGAQGIQFAKITPDLALKAVDMVYKLTQGSAMESFMDAVTAAMSDEPEKDEDYMTAIEASDAARSADEAAQADAVQE